MEMGKLQYDCFESIFLNWKQVISLMVWRILCGWKLKFKVETVKAQIKPPLKLVQKLEFLFRLATNDLCFKWVIYQKNRNGEKSLYLEFGVIWRRVEVIWHQNFIAIVLKKMENWAAFLGLQGNYQLLNKLKNIIWS